MAWNTKFYHEFYDSNDLLCRVDILEDGTPSAVELEGQASPFNIIFPEIKDKLEPVRGSGCELNLFSATDRQLLSLFTAEMMQYRIKYTVATATIWFGYLDSEQYSEDYSQLTDYPLQFTGNNGLGILDRIKFLDGANNYTGLKTQWEVLTAIFNKWGLLDYVTAIKVKIATDSAYFTIGATETIFHKTYIKCANYYDEDNEPMSCREILEAILAPYGAFLTIIGTEILIVDLHTLGTNSGFTWKVFDNTLTYDTTEASEAIGDIETIGYYETGAKLDMVTGRNMQTVKYSPYAVEDVEDDIQWNGDYTEPGSNMTFSSGSSPLYNVVGDGTTERAYNITGLDDWDFEVGSDNLDRLTGYKENTGANPEFCLRIENDNHWGIIGDEGDVDDTLYLDTHSSREWDIPYVVGNGTYYLKISGLMRALGGQWTAPEDLLGEDPYDPEPDTDISHFSVHIRLWIGTESFGQTVWNTNTNWFHLMAGKEDGSNALNKWQPFRTWRGGTPSPTGMYPITEDGVIIRFDLGTQGKIKIEFTPQIYGYKDSSQIPYDGRTRDIKAVEIKNIKIELVELPDMKVAGTEDVEYIGKINEAWKDKGSTITLEHGSSHLGVGTPFDRGGLMHDDGGGDYRYIINWVRNGNTRHIEELLLNTIQSNYETKTTQLAVNLNNTSHLPFLRAEDDAYLSGQILMFTGGTLDCAHNSLECILLQIKPDNLTIA